MPLKLAEFVSWVVKTNCWEYRDLDGGDVQDMAVKCGILTETTYDPEKHGESEWDNEPGDPWYVFSDEFKNALKKEDPHG